MEDLFLLIIKESTGTKHNALRQTAQIAYDKLYRQHGIHRDPSHELRSVCFTALQMALDTKRPKFITMGLNGLHRVIKDERFYIGLEPEDDSVWLPSQLLRATNGILPTTSSEDTVVNVLRLFLAMACSPACTLNGRLLIEILSRCGECWEMGSRATKAASLAAASQCLRTFCAFLIEEAEEVKKTAPAGLMTQTQASAVYNEVIPVMQWLCSRLVEPNVNASPNKKCENHSSLYLTECILTLSSALPRNVHANPHFTSFLWQKFCPTLAAALGSPGRINLDKKFTYKLVNGNQSKNIESPNIHYLRDALHMIENEARGFFTGPGLDGPQARCVYLTAIQLLRIAGAHGSLRPMLEALFHRMLLLPAPQNRTEPLRCVREIFKSPERLIDLAVILYVDKNTAQGCSDEMALFRLLVDAMEECAYGASGVGSATEASLQASVECMVALLDSLQVLCSGELTESMISDQIVQVVNGRHDLLKDADYSGPLTYQSMARLPAPYRDAIVEFRQTVFETSSGSESEGEPQHEQDAASNGSGDTEGPEDDDPSSSSDETSRVENRWPYSHLEAPVMPIRTDSDNDRQHARDFARALRQDLVPKLLRLRSCVELDEAMQEFASAAACHRDRMISKRAIEYIHDIITALLVEQSELPYFHFNEALLKPFENLLSMDTDVDVQDQIVACLYEVVEAHRTEIRSGWRPLFGTLRNARSRMLNMSNIIDIFRVFLDSDNTLVFANAGLDCILCLLSYLEISGGGNNNACSGGSGSAAGGTASSGGQQEEDNTFRPTDFLHETLRFLERCSSILGFMHSMPKCPNFHSTYKIKGISYTHIIDANIPSSMENFTYFGNDYLQTRNEQYMISYRSLHIDKDTIVKIDEMDKPSGVLKVWFLLLDGLTNSLIVCPYSHQAPILQTIFKLFKNLLTSPGIDFGFYCINHLLVPMIQDWLRYINKTGSSWQLVEKNFKHCCCMTTDLVVEFIEKSVPEQRRLGAGTKTRLAQIVHPADNLLYSKLKFVTERIEREQQQQQSPSVQDHGCGYTQQYDSSSSSASEEQQKNGGGVGGGGANLIESPTKISGSATLALKQLLLVLIECAAQSQEAIARISVSCLKHVILSTGMLFNESQWDDRLLCNPSRPAP
ncbi:GD16779 [Drosophila simulans]|uniref:GD16779 n=1 Tax=Drosophila simulans TaxID=7240 RepID=B4R5B9_DROSI|nr:GD16779 [Drosophila simulans]